MSDNVKNPTTAALSMPSANTQYSFTFPQFTKRIMFWLRDPGTYLIYSWQPGHVAAPTDPYSQLLPGVIREIQNFQADGPITCYFATSNTGMVLQIEYWS